MHRGVASAETVENDPGWVKTRDLNREPAPADFSARLPAVRRALYLLFNEGYQWSVR